MFRVESFLSARLFLAPQMQDNRIYFLSNLSGRLSLYAMNAGGSVPEPLLPPDIALQNPHLIEGEAFYVFPDLGQILIMMDQDGDESYQPVLIPNQGGYPEPAFQGFFQGSRVHCTHCDQERALVYFVAESRTEPMQRTYQANLKTGELLEIGASPFGYFPVPNWSDPEQAALAENITTGDSALYEWQKNQSEHRLLFGIPFESRNPGQEVPLNGITSLEYANHRGILVLSAVFDNCYSFGYLDLDQPGVLKPVTVHGMKHSGIGETVRLSHLDGQRFAVEYNIDSVSWLYEGIFDTDQLTLTLENVICGAGELANGVLEHFSYNKASDMFVLSFSTATSPTQIYSIGGQDRSTIIRHTNERVLGLDASLLSEGEDASFTSFDGTRISARLYLPSKVLKFTSPRPVVYYVHGGPQGQERPDFAWFSMPLIQFLTLNGFAVFVPNVRGSTGYGLSYTKEVDKDWGGRDRLDHVHALQTLTKDSRLDTNRSAVVGRSYGGYMTLTLAGRHPDLWKAAVDMFGPFDLITFLQRIPPTWKPYYEQALGDLVTDREFLVERSPKTYMDQLACPMLVIQGKNDPRVVEPESHDLVEYLRKTGKQVDYLVFDNEGHDVLKLENRVRCYTAITDFFKKHLNP